MVVERVQKALISLRKMLQSSIVAHAHLLHPVQARDLLISWPKNSLVCSSSLAHTRRVKARS